MAVVGGFVRLMYPRLRLGRRLLLAGGDDAVGLGGVAGVRERLVPGAGWVRVGSWPELGRAVAGRGVGASAVVLVSYAGDEPGHALVLHATNEGLAAAAGALDATTGGLEAVIRGLRWVDPAGVTGERPLLAGHSAGSSSGSAIAGREASDLPEALRGAVAAWAVVVGPDGRVVEPGGWVAPVGMLADPPTRHDFGAMGAEIEQ